MRSTAVTVVGLQVGAACRVDCGQHVDWQLPSHATQTFVLSHAFSESEVYVLLWMPVFDWDTDEASMDSTGRAPRRG